MKVSLNLAQVYSNVDLKSIPRDELLRRIGAQLGAVEDVIDWAPKFEGAAVVRVVSCDKHPDADRLNVCRVDDGGHNQQVERGDDGLIQVVCGAPNVKAGMYAVWLAPGVVVPSTRDKDPFTLEAREIRGVISNGMMASAHELGISEDHSGIVGITTEDAGREPAPGEPLTNYFGLDDFVIDCENKMFTHRPDCFGNLGVARELAGISGLSFENPDWYWKQPEPTEVDETLPINTKNEVPELVPRFMAVTMSGITVGPSPMWLQAVLTRVGIKPINNVVDITNYVMHLTGQPLHAFDYDKIKRLSDHTGIFPRMSNKGEKLTLLGQKEIELTGGEIVISTDKQAVALGGIMGGFDTEVDENTKNIVIECATFDMYSIRRSSMRHGLFTDAVTRFNKGQSPIQNDRVLWYAMKNMAELAGAQQASNIVDIQSPQISQALQDYSLSRDLAVSPEFVNQRLGTEFSADDIAELLRRVNFACIPTDEGNLEVTAPFWRTDIEIQEDIVEEVGRLYGYDKLPVALPSRTSRPTPRNDLLDYKMHIRYMLKERGANEVLTYSFVHGDLLAKVGINADEACYHIRNAISPDLQYYRPSLIPSLLAKVHPNIKAQAGRSDNQFALFEIGKAHIKDQLDSDGLPIQMERLALVVAADDKTAKSNDLGTAYYLAKKYIDMLTNGQARFTPISDNSNPLDAPFATGRSAEVTLGGEVIGVVGESSANVRSRLKLPDFCAGLEVDLSKLKELTRDNFYIPLPPLPGTWLDYTHKTSHDTTWAEALSQVEAPVKDIASRGYKVAIEPKDIFAPEDSRYKSYTFRIHMSHPDKTMTTEEATRLLNEATAKLHK